MLVPRIVFVDVACAAGALTHRTERQLAKATDLAHQWRIGCERAAADLLAVLRAAEEIESCHRPGDRTWRFGGSDGFGIRSRVCALAEPVKRCADVTRQPLRFAIEIELDDVADAQAHATAASGKHLARQQSGAGPLDQHRSAVEQRRIARLDTDRQQRCTRRSRETQETRAPAPVTHATRGQPRDLAGREDDDAFLALERRLDRADRSRADAAAEHAQRQQQFAQRLDCGQEIVGDDADIAAHAANRVQQGEGIQCARGMIGHHQQPSAGGDPREVGGIHQAIGLQMRQGRADEIQAAGAIVVVKEGLDPIEL